MDLWASAQLLSRGHHQFGSLYAMSAGAHPQARLNKCVRMNSLNPKHILLLLLHLLRCMHLSNLSSNSLVRKRRVQCKDLSKQCRKPETFSQRQKLPHWKSISETNHLSPLRRPKLRLVPLGTDTQRLASISAHMLGHYVSSSPGNEV